MNKTAIKDFAVWARNKLISDISYKASLIGITGEEISDPLSQSTNDVQFFDIGTREPYSITGKEILQRQKLVDIIKHKTEQGDYQTAVDSVIEEVAYTWFNRLIAIRFMEVNDYLPSRVRVLSSESPGKTEPDLVTNPFDSDLNFTNLEKNFIVTLKQDNELDELFRFLFIKQCNALNTILPELFEKTNDYMELLLNISFTDKEGIVAHLVDANNISEDDFKEQVQIIGWLYQYYNDERKNEVINIYKGNVKKEDIPAATQLFTTDWVVRYMVDNSLGLYWLERNPQSKLRGKLTYFVTPQEDMIYLDEKVKPQDLTFFDPCMGSGHILVYAFDVLIEIYRECGYSDRDAAVNILQNNLYGLDIDDRAYQLAYFALMMKARSYNRRVFSLDIEPHVYAIQESNNIKQFTINSITTKSDQNRVGEYLIECFKDAKEIGSILTVKQEKYDDFINYLDTCENTMSNNLDELSWKQNVLPKMYALANQADIMAEKYAVVVTNPPYLNKMSNKLKQFVVKNFKPYSGDLFSVFIYRNFDFCKSNGYSAFMSPFVWMFIKTYENLRKYIIESKAITTLVQMEYSSFEEATVPICSFVLKNAYESQPGIYFKLSDFKGGMDIQREKILESISNPQCDYRHTAHAENFTKIPGMPVAYWASNNALQKFINKPLGDEVIAIKGLDTCDNDRFVREWHEVNSYNIGFNLDTTKDTFIHKWFPYSKGGGYRKWYGFKNNVVDWEKDGKVLRNLRGENGKIKSRPQNIKYYFKEGLTWSTITSAKLSMRYMKNSIFGGGGSGLFTNNIQYKLALLNSKITEYFLLILNPTLNFLVGDIKAIPLIYPKNRNNRIDILVENNVTNSIVDYDSFETSWDFTCHPLLTHKGDTLESSYSNWKNFVENQFLQLKSNEEELNRIFIDIYGLQEELTPEVADKDVTVARIYDYKEDIPENMKGNRYVLTKEDVVKSFISYAVGCMFGRYSLDREGLVFAGGNFDDVYWRYRGMAPLDHDRNINEGGYAGIGLASEHYPRFRDHDNWEEATKITFEPVADNILLITDEEYYEDDIVGLFVAFVKKVYGIETLEENLNFIADALGGKEKSSREVIRNYFLKDFFKDHCKTYKKRPIYWLFDSGRTNGFKALIYMHRYDEDTIGNLRIDYLHQIQQVYTREISRMQETIDNSSNGREVATAEKRKEKLTKQLKETTDYDEKISHLALARTAIDLDDGVKVNYEKVQTDTEGNKLEVLAKIR